MAHVHAQRTAFVGQARTWGGRRVIFFDEFGFRRGESRRYGYALRGLRATATAPVNADPNLTLIVGLTQRGTFAPFVFEGAMDGSAFVQYVHRKVVPFLRKGDIVVVDGLGAHRAPQARALIEARGARFQMLPPYSPDLNPVEECGSAIKAHVRRYRPHSVQEVYDALGVAIGKVRSSHARGWFSHRAPYLSPHMPDGQSRNRRHQGKRTPL